jgi:hypothetical protein
MIAGCKRQPTIGNNISTWRVSGNTGEESHGGGRGWRRR